MASIKRFHQNGCNGQNCECAWRLDYRPQGFACPHKRIEFPTKKAAERHLTATAHNPFDKGVGACRMRSTGSIVDVRRERDAVLTNAAAIFKPAIRRGYATTNPAAIAERPRRTVVELTVGGETPEREKGSRAVQTDEVLSGDEIRKLLAHGDPGLYRTLFATVACDGHVA